jgi:hypothetical protein
MRVIAIGDELQDADQQHRDGSAEIEQVRRAGQDLVRLAQVGVQVGGRALSARELNRSSPRPGRRQRAQRLWSTLAYTDVDSRL